MSKQQPKSTWHKPSTDSLSMRVVAAILDDPMVNWEKEPGYFLLSFVVHMPLDVFEGLLKRYQVDEAGFGDALQVHTQKIELDLCKRKLQSLWKKQPELYKEFCAIASEDPQSLKMAYCDMNGQVQICFVGRNASDLSKALARENLAISVEHALYVGRELVKLQLALENSQMYVQD